jgi:hypothetical protein
MMRRCWDRVYTHLLCLQLRLWPPAGEVPEEPARASDWPERVAAMGHWLMTAGVVLLVLAWRRRR